MFFTKFIKKIYIGGFFVFLLSYFRTNVCGFGFGIERLEGSYEEDASGLEYEDLC
jgi:hypothetical protein